MKEKKTFRSIPGLSREEEEKQLADILTIAQSNLKHTREQIRSLSEEVYDLMETYGPKDKEALSLLRNTQAQLEDTKRNLVRCEKARKKPYFGRIDFRDQKLPQEESYYVGRVGISDKDSEPVVIDWRAPVASIYYENSTGLCQYEVKNHGTYEVDLKRKRTYEIENDQLKDFFDSDVVANDELLTKYLAKSKKAVLGEIIATIQQEQNAIIRNTKDRILVIQGAAGSGKTSVALHRIAYLLYHDRQNLKSSNILILSPNGVFSDYISHILPELGEENIQEMSFDLFAYRKLQDTAADCEDRCDQIEREMRDPKAAERFALKQSQAFVDQMEGFALELEDELMNFSDVSYKSFVKSESEIITLFYDKFADIPLLSRMDAVAETFIDEIETLLNRDLPEEERIPLIEKFQKMYETMDFYVLYNRFLKKEGYQTLPRRPLEKRKLRYEDVYPVLYLKYRLSRQAERSNIKHLVIDEMQDYSRLQYLIIRRMFSCKMTILGDRAQTMADQQQDVLQFLPGIFGKDLRRIEMRKSYRNTVEIASYAANLIGVTDLELFERHGMPVLERDVTDLEAALREAVDTLFPDEKTYETAAVIVPDEKTAERAYLILREILAEKDFDCGKRLSWLNRDSSSFKKGLTVTTFYLAKGLEFDQVFSIFPKDEKREMMMQAQYIAATRALHELRVYHI